MINFKVFLISATVFFLVACRADKEERVLKGSEYFPVKVGTVQYYTIDTIIFDAFAPSIDTIRHEIKEEVMEQLINGPGDTSYRIEHSLYDKDKLEWVPYMSFERKVSRESAIEKMDNREEVKLLFPISEYKTKGSAYTWNLNMFNGRDPVIVKYASVSRPFSDISKSYNDCVVVKLNKPSVGLSLVNNVREEVYAKDIGLVYRFTDSTDFLMNIDNLSGIQTIIRLK
jgi:hypothetical protein